MSDQGKPLAPFTLRMSANERKQLKRLAQDMKLSQAAFIRAKVFDGLPGTLNLKNDEIEAQLHESYEAIVWMRQTLIKTLGLSA